MKLLAIDLGYSNVKVAYYNESGALQFQRFISACAKVDSPIDMDDDTMFRLGVDTYILGTAALKVSRSLHMPLETFEDMKAVYPVWISYLLKKFGPVDKVIIGLSVAFVEKADELLNYLYDTLLITDTDFFMCLPQGVSCKVGYEFGGLDIRETRQQHQDSRLTNLLIIDGGHLTIDTVVVSGNSTSASSATSVEKSGTINICYNIVDYLFKEYQMMVSIKEAQVILDNNGVFERRGRKYDISKAVEKFTKDYLAKVLGLIEEQYGEYLDVVEGIVILGGLGYFFRKYINDEDVVAEIEKHFPKSFVHIANESEYYNAYSYLKIAEKKLGLA